jgi:hypothetical protein
MRGKVTADAYSGRRVIGCGVIEGEGVHGAEVRGDVIRVRGFAMRDDDWEVTRPRVTTAH